MVYPCARRIASTKRASRCPLNRCVMSCAIWSRPSSSRSRSALSSAAVFASSLSFGGTSTGFGEPSFHPFAASERTRASASLRPIFHTVMKAPIDMSRSLSKAVLGTSFAIHFSRREW